MTDLVALRCQQVVELVTDYLEGALDTGMTARFREHLRECPHCTEYLDQVRRTIRGLGQVPADPLPPETMAGLLAEFGRFLPEQPKPRRKPFGRG
jgi:predicted anti-sigma-YlaC factor YlaD